MDLEDFFLYAAILAVFFIYAIMEFGETAEEDEKDGEIDGDGNDERPCPGKKETTI